MKECFWLAAEYGLAFKWRFKLALSDLMCAKKHQLHSETTMPCSFPWNQLDRCCLQQIVILHWNVATQIKSFVYVSHNAMI